jgi:uncharacterized protein with GYD domain
MPEARWRTRITQEDQMGHYAMMMKLTTQGKGRVLRHPSAFAAHVKDAWRSIEGEAEIYLMMGEYDFLVVGSAPRADDVGALAIALSLDGDVSINTTCLHPSRDWDKLFGITPAIGKFHFDVDDDRPRK